MTDNQHPMGINHDENGGCDFLNKILSHHLGCRVEFGRFNDTEGQGK